MYRTRGETSRALIKRRGPRGIDWREMMDQGLKWVIKYTCLRGYVYFSTPRNYDQAAVFTIPS